MIPGQLVFDRRLGKVVEIVKPVSAMEIGHWWAMCCELDLLEIQSAEDLSEAIHCVDEYGARAWRTKEDAIAEINTAR